ncbi:hypothetical protein AR158_c273R [Paramecium bursaria Chlorella virus AR158]|uniref:hypothetical protein n=1 Tax=Paramecium bursaria Chlorella virus AR158 TaxID=380598 RepID=UPI00015AA8E1|nr:hypothetical protein AR158_c273R [Paramecium bursaria Chlorella virus AR158]ABU43818.1 hypothetical protein AR158_c273R [Paramecium bursaria Chlorella virus AR158]
MDFLFFVAFNCSPISFGRCDSVEIIRTWYRRRKQSHNSVIDFYRISDNVYQKGIVRDKNGNCNCGIHSHSTRNSDEELLVGSSINDSIVFEFHR